MALNGSNLASKKNGIEKIRLTRRQSFLTTLGAGAAVVVALGMTGCGTQSSQDSSQPAGEPLSIVSVTNVYGDVASAIGKDRVKVTSLISNANQDPHSYNTTAQDKLAVSKASLLIENGGGYDDFFSKLIQGSDQSKVINVVDLSGLKKAGDDEFNEHVWYSLPTISTFADQLAAKLGSMDSAHAQEFKDNAAAFKASVSKLEDELKQVKSKADGQPVAITEPVPLYMLEEAGLVNKTPHEYSHAIEDGSDVPAAVMNETTELIKQKQVKFLAYNDQTEGPQTTALRTAADAAKVPVVNFTETLPEGKSYLEWMQSNVDSIAQVFKA